VSVRCSLLQCVATICVAHVLQCVAHVLQCVAVCGSVQCVAQYVLQCAQVRPYIAVCCSVLPCVAVCCSVLQYVAVHGRAWQQYTARVRENKCMQAHHVTI